MDIIPKIYPLKKRLIYLNTYKLKEYRVKNCTKGKRKVEEEKKKRMYRGRVNTFAARPKEEKEIKEKEKQRERREKEMLREERLKVCKI